MSVNIIADLTDEQMKNVKNRLCLLNNICICDNCNALIQFDDNDINREKTLPHISCPCGNSIQLHSKYYKAKV